MSSGKFTETFYTANYGGINAVHPIRLQPETTGATVGGTPNVPGVAAATNPISAIVSKSRRGLGLHPRRVYMKLTGDPPAGYDANARATLVCLTETFYNLAAIKGAQVTYLTVPWTVTGFDAEKAL